MVQVSSLSLKRIHQVLIGTSVKKEIYKKKHFCSFLKWSCLIFKKKENEDGNEISGKAILYCFDVHLQFHKAWYPSVCISFSRDDYDKLFYGRGELSPCATSHIMIEQINVNSFLDCLATYAYHSFM